MADLMACGDAPAIAKANLAAFFRNGADVPVSCRAALVGSLSRLRGSDDPVVTFSRLPGACVPDFADGCLVELSDGAEPPVRLLGPAGSVEAPESAAVLPAGTAQVLATPFRVVSAIGYPSYAGVVTHWWASRKPSELDAVIADLMVKHLVALVDHERLMAAVARAEDRAASLALEAISGRTISLATGIVMHQNGLAADDAEDLLRRSARMTGEGLHEVAAVVVHSRRLGAGRAGLNRTGPRRIDLPAPN
jgi:hypothetical protein